MRRSPLLTCVVLATVLAAACAGRHTKVDDAGKAARSWAATVKVITEQWAQARVSLRFTRTTIRAAAAGLDQQAAAIRTIDPARAARIDRLKDAIAPVMAAVALNDPAQARDRAQALPALAQGIAASPPE